MELFTGMLLLVLVASSFFRQGFSFALALQAYQFESTLGGSSFIGVALNALPLLCFVKSISTLSRFRITSVDILLICILLLMSLCALLSPDVYTSLGKVLKFLLLGSVLYFAGRVAMYGNEPMAFIGDFLGCMIITTAFFIIAAVSDRYDLRTNIGDGTAVGFSLAINVSIAAAGLLLLLGGWRRWGWIGFGCLVAALALLVKGAIDNGTRGAFVGSALGIVASLLLLASIRNPRVAARALLVVIAFSAAAVPMKGYLGLHLENFARGIDNERVSGPLLKVARLLDSSAGTYSLDEAASIRMELYDNAIMEIMKQPISGLGPAAMEIKYGIYAHNVFLEAWIETGLVGLTLWVMLVVFLVRSFSEAYRRSGNDPLVIALFGIWAATLIQLQFSFTLWMAKSFFVAAGIAVSLAAREDVASATTVGLRTDGSGSGLALAHNDIGRRASS